MSNYAEEIFKIYQQYLPEHLLNKMFDKREPKWQGHQYAWPKELAADVIEAMMKSDYVLTGLDAYLSYPDENDFSIIREESTYKEIEQTEDFEEKKQMAREKGLRLLKDWETTIPNIIRENNDKAKYELVVLWFSHKNNELVNKKPEPEKILLKERIKNIFRALKY